MGNFPKISLLKTRKLFGTSGNSCLIPGRYNIYPEASQFFEERLTQG